MRKTLILTLIGASLLAATPAVGAPSGLARVRNATARFHDVSKAEAAGYEEFLSCFDSEEGGMGQHYVDVSALDDKVRRNHPEALVYEVRPNGKLKLVGVEYIVPSDFVDPGDPPRLFGRDFHENPALGVWVLHAYIWKRNPLGMFEDWNPRVGACPDN